MGKTPIKSMGFEPQPAVQALKSSFIKDPLSISKSNLFPSSLKGKANELAGSVKYAQKNGSIVALGTTGVENEDEMISLMEEEIFLENSLESTKALMNYDCWDEECDPEDWIKRYKSIEPPHAKSPIYMNKRYLWAGVEIIGWNKEQRKFLVKIMLNGHEKYVSRLSLMFLNEDHAKFMERVQVCKQRQQRAEDEIRFFKYVEGKSDELVSVLDVEAKKNILSKTRGKKKDEESQSTSRLIESLMGQVEMEYKLFMKKVVVLGEMQEAINTDKFKNLRIKMRFIKNEIPFLGTIAKFDYSKENMDNVKIKIDFLSFFLKKNMIFKKIFFF